MKRTGFARRVYQRQPSPPVRPIVGCRGVYAPAANEPVVVPNGIESTRCRQNMEGAGMKHLRAVAAGWMNEQRELIR